MFPRPVIRENRSRTLLRIETVANTLPSKSHVRPPWIKGKVREREKKKKKKKNTYASFENNDSRSSSRSIDRYRELVSSRGVTREEEIFFTLSNDLFFIAFHER